MKNAYVIALTTSILSGMNPEAALTRVHEVLVQKGHVRLWPQILKASQRVLEAKLKREQVQFVVAKAENVPEATIVAALTALGAATTTERTVRVDSTLIGGFTARFKGAHIDASYKRALLELYRTVTNRA